MSDRVGQQLGNYRLLKLLGEGGFAEVYLGEHLHLGSLAAIKVLYDRLGPEDQDRFLSEARTIVRLKHPNIVRLLEFGLEGSTPFLVMDYAPGGTLRQRHPKGQPVPLATLLPSVRQVADALQYAHEQKLIHRDLKPENLLLGERGEVLLSDFGIATVAHSSRYERTQDVAGTVAYMAPEQIKGHPRPASDQYALGIVVYEWLSGSRPFQGSFSEIASQHLFASPPSLREQLPTLPPAVEQVVLTALEKDPQQRFASLRAFATAFAGACQLEQGQDAAALVSVPSGPTSPAPVGSGGWETWLLQAPTQLIAPPPPAEAASQTAVGGQPPETVLPVTALVPTTPVGFSPVEATMPAPATEVSEAAAGRSTERVPQPPGRRSPARARRLVAGGLSAALIVVLVALLLLTRVAAGGAQTTALATALAATHQTMQTSTALSGTSTAITQSQQATATTQSQNATATAQVYAPYRALIPGPCDTSSNGWTVSDSYLCLSDRLRLMAGQAYGNRFTNLVYHRQPFPLNYTVSIDMSNFVGDTYVNFAQRTLDIGFFWDFYQDGSWALFRSTAGAPSPLIASGSFDPKATTTIGMTFQGMSSSFLLNNRQVYSRQEASAPTTTSIEIGVGIATVNGPGPAQADFQNFVFTPLA